MCILNLFKHETNDVVLRHHEPHKHIHLCSVQSLWGCRAEFTSPSPGFFQVGERLARYDVEKRCAIDKEDYDLAKKKKELMEEYRRSVYQQLEVHNLLDMTMVSHQALTYMLTEGLFV